MQYLIIETSVDYDREAVLSSLLLDGSGHLHPDTELMLCTPLQSFTEVRVSPPTSPPSSPRSRSPEPLVLAEEDVENREVELDPVAAGCLLHLLINNRIYRKRFSRFWTAKRESRDQRLRIRLTKPTMKLIDYLGGQMANKVIWEYIELEDALHWLSTLGGAFSNLGEHHQGFAVKAGENALKQLVVAQRFGDKNVVAKCWLFVAMSQMQQGRYKLAKRIVRFVYKQTQTKGMRELVGTGKIVTICRGVWNRLVYEYKLNRPAEIEVECKFAFTEGFRTALLELGAVKIKELKMQDIYLDQKNYEFVRSDCWLRFRDGVLELKSPNENVAHKGSATIYREDTELKTIKDRLGVPELPSSPQSLPPAWTILAQINTNRENWRLDDMAIALDTLEDGFTVGEIELVVHSNSQVDGARARIEALAARLGCTTQFQGKVDHCVRIQNPDAYQFLVERNEKMKKVKALQ